MTQEDKALLLKDLCARLPYGIKAGTTDNDGSLENVWDILWYNTFANNVELMHCIEDDSKLIDIIPCTEAAIKNIESVPVWKA